MSNQRIPRFRPKVTFGKTERVETPRGPIYVTINRDEQGVCEVFVRSLDEEADVIGRLVSLLLRTGVDPREVLEQLWRVSSRQLVYDKINSHEIVPVTTIAQGISLALGRFLYGAEFNPSKKYPRASDLPEVSND